LIWCIPPVNEEKFITGRKNMTKEERRAHWRDIIEGQQASGMTIAAWCRANQVPTTSFYTIKRRLKEREAVTGGFLELKTVRFMAPASAGIHIHIGNNLSIDVERGFDPFTFRAVIETLGGSLRCSA